MYSFKILDGEEVFIKSGIIIYIFDTLKWINTFDKLKIKKNKGLFHRGSTYFEECSIKKLKEIIFCWKKLFNEANENFKLIGEFNVRKEEYDIENYNKKEVIESLEKLINLCDKAEKEDKIIKCTKVGIKSENN